MALNDPLRQEAAPYSGHYYKYVKSKVEEDLPPTCAQKLDTCGCNGNLDDLSTEELEDGWEQIEQGDYIVKVKNYMSQTNSYGSVHKTGDRKRTYEVIVDDGCNTYNLEQVPAYRRAVVGLKEGLESLLEEKEGINDMYNKRKHQKGKGDNEVWRRDVVTDAKLRHSMTEEQKTEAAYLRFKAAGNNHEVHHDDDDDEYVRDEGEEKFGSDSESSEESDESDEMKLVPDKKPKDHSVKLPPIKP
eukprot:CAMPEP_0119053854 /NCGR_PEP_ID=MMETSP1177-20130426/74692_1 /TAXON_ID=2985 /ORGANISM="Ochromonas sp, Strain CCMP1899" /LENGTH=243 /DNA_ID=CAMNT_0007033921 /DNA_START=3545 /DNA_END=4276 /DNA_ORIENTATION=-